MRRVWKQIDLGVAVHLPLDEFELGNLRSGHSTTERRWRSRTSERSDETCLCIRQPTIQFFSRLRSDHRPKVDVRAAVRLGTLLSIAAIRTAAQRFSGPVRMLMENRYVFNPFWQHHNGIEGYKDWEEKFRISSRSLGQAFQAGDNVRVLSFVFDRLYVLRNQLVHGGVTWNSGVNRAQVRDGAAILACLIPVFVDIMMDNPHEDWRRPFYPVVK